MSRYCGPNSGVDKILAAAEQWKNVALLNDGSVFADRQLWTLDGMESLEAHFIKNLGMVFKTRLTLGTEARNST